MFPREPALAKQRVPLGPFKATLVPVVVDLSTRPVLAAGGPCDTFLRDFADGIVFAGTPVEMGAIFPIGHSVPGRD